MQKTPLAVCIAVKAYKESPLSILQTCTCMRTIGIALRITNAEHTTLIRSLCNAAYEGQTSKQSTLQVLLRLQNFLNHSKPITPLK